MLEKSVFMPLSVVSHLSAKFLPSSKTKNHYVE